MDQEWLAVRRPERGLDHRGRPYGLPLGAWWRGGARSPVRRFWFWLILIAVYVLAISASVLLPDTPGWPVVLLLSPLGCATFFVIVPLAYRFASRSVVPAGVRLAHYHCGSCEYDLRGLEPEPDGCRLCPECNAAWRLWPRCRACGGTLTDAPLAAHGWYECTGCGECWREPTPPPPQGEGEDAARSGDHLSQSSSTSVSSVK